jgi:hypothetical protein
MKAFWFQHDSSARHDQKILQLRTNHGWEGYGLFWALVESLLDCPNYEMPLDAIAGLSLGYGLANGTLNGLLETCYKVGLLSHNETHFWSDSLKRRMEKLGETRKTLSDAGKRGAEARWAGHKPRNTTPMAIHNNRKQKRYIDQSSDWYKSLPKDFPGIDIDDEYRRAMLWEKDNPHQDHKRLFKNWLLNAKPNYKPKVMELA